MKGIAAGTVLLVYRTLTCFPSCLSTARRHAVPWKHPHGNWLKPRPERCTWQLEEVEVLQARLDSGREAVLGDWNLDEETHSISFDTHGRHYRIQQERIAGLLVGQYPLGQLDRLVGMVDRYQYFIEVQAAQFDTVASEPLAQCASCAFQ